ncbi:MAG: hypothetical protein JWO31_1816 [Phycisphaerales bacterium]|nr:hypothetical protein [Phycisphaerales bacterium]
MLWVRSWSVADLLDYDTGVRGGTYHADLEQGGVVLVKARWESAENRPAGWTHHRITGRDVSAELGGYHFPAFGTPDVQWGEGGRDRYSALLRLPFWMAAALFAGPPASYLRRARRAAARHSAGLCPACGYDLRASPGLCPECGAEPKGVTA